MNSDDNSPQKIKLEKALAQAGSGRNLLYSELIPLNKGFSDSPTAEPVRQLLSSYREQRIEDGKNDGCATPNTDRPRICKLRKLRGLPQQGDGKMELFCTCSGHGSPWLKKKQMITLSASDATAQASTNRVGLES